MSRTFQRLNLSKYIPSPISPMTYPHLSSLSCSGFLDISRWRSIQPNLRDSRRETENTEIHWIQHFLIFARFSDKICISKNIFYFFSVLSDFSKILNILIEVTVSYIHRYKISDWVHLHVFDVYAYYQNIILTSSIFYFVIVRICI